ncbi:MAG: YifB family Mg chelatase-like AAA ATPase [Candidatus Gracilibacteria bacterium]|nr:YifB family Mg chelatase-like AAA ATPase [Candidatus Gracilibacteria bacterium]
MISLVNSISVNGLASTVINIEVDINQGLPAFTIVGLPDQGVQESKERLRSAMKSSGAKLPVTRITVNLAPADIKKSGPSFDLPIAVGILLNEGYVEHSELVETSIFLGELSLDGSLRKVSGVLPSVIGAKERGFKRIFIPKDNSLEASIIPDIDVIAIESLKELIDILNKDKELTAQEKYDFKSSLAGEEIEHIKHDFKYIVGQEHAKRALEIAAAGGHNIIMSGPPGSGKTMLAKTYSTILPDLTLEEAIEISKIYSISGLLDNSNPIVRKRPFRTVHHTASGISIIGGGRNAKPGEISLAHKGILFLDEILEFNKSVLEVLRQPIEDGYITVTRVNATYEYPAKFSLVGAMNPCPCGYLSDPDRDCSCSPLQVKSYSSRLSGPLIDRVDLFIEVPKVKTSKLEVSDDYGDKEDSATIKKRVEAARNKQIARFKNNKITYNSEMGTKEINEFCKLNETCQNILKQAVANLKLSARSYYRLLKLSRTIADLEGSEHIDSHHILEAISYRKVDS